jgi:hypothetical protein
MFHLIKLKRILLDMKFYIHQLHLLHHLQQLLHLLHLLLLNNLR